MTWKTVSGNKEDDRRLKNDKGGLKPATRGLKMMEPSPISLRDVIIYRCSPMLVLAPPSCS